MKNTLKKKLLVGFSAVSILFGSVFGSLAACTETEISSKDFSGYAIIKITNKYVLHKNNKDSFLDTECGFYTKNSSPNLYICHRDNSFTTSRNTEFYKADTKEELVKVGAEWNTVCEECFPDGIEAE